MLYPAPVIFVHSFIGLEHGAENTEVFHVGLYLPNVAGRLFLLLLLPVDGRANRKGGNWADQ